MEKKAKILIVDDDEISSFLATNRLKNRGFEVERVPNGKRCLEYLEANDPEVILLDVMMPGISGIKVLEEARKKYQPLELPIIMVTSQGEAANISFSFKKGANDYLVKPLNIEIAAARINTQVVLHRFYLDSIEKKQVETLNAMIATYNHEINNPLCIALGCLELGIRKNDTSFYPKIKESMVRVRDIVKKIEKITGYDIVLEKYAKSSKIINIK